MINLLPNDFKQNLHYGRLNIRLIRLLLVSLVMIVTLALILGIGWLYMDRQIKDLNNSIAATEQQLSDQNLEQVRKQADEINQNIKVINQVLHREIRFSSLLDEVGKVLPPGTKFSSLTLSDKVDGAIDLNADAKDPKAAAQMAVNISDPKNNLFSKADVVSVNCSSQVKEYPCSVKLRALFDSKTAERFLNTTAGDNQ
jgi:Tfp pilus assembly protein PilN